MAGVGNKPGAGIGGRPAGVPNRATTERALEAERQLVEARASGKKLAKDVLEQFMLAFAAMAASAQPRPGNEQQANVRDFEKWGKLAVATAARLAPFQSPTFRAILIGDPSTIASGLLPGAAVTMAPGAELLTFPTDAIGISRIYRRLVDGVEPIPPSLAPPGGLSVVAIADDDAEVGPAEEEPPL